MAEIKWSTLVKKAQEDAAFKKALLENPKAAIEKETGVTLPENVTYHVHEQTATDVHLVLPLDTEADAQSSFVFISD